MDKWREHTFLKRIYRAIDMNSLRCWMALLNREMQIVPIQMAKGKILIMPNANNRAFHTHTDRHIRQHSLSGKQFSCTSYTILIRTHD